MSSNLDTLSGTISQEGSLSGGLSSSGELSGGVQLPYTIADYEQLTNLPEVNDITLIGNKTSEDLNIVACKTSAEWAQLTTLQSVKGEIYIYSDAGEDADGNPAPKIKIGDGNAYVVDLPFVDADAHDIRITDAMIASWNDKVSVRVAGDQLIFY